mgnify:CR=1 FL=1
MSVCPFFLCQGVCIGDIIERDSIKAAYGAIINYEEEFTMKKTTTLLLVLCMVLSVFALAGCQTEDSVTKHKVTFYDGETVLKGCIYNGDIKYAEILFKTPNTDTSSDELLVQIKPDQYSEPILCQYTLYINFLDIAKQTANLDSTITEDQLVDVADAVAEVLKTAETLYQDVVVPMLIVCDPSLTDGQLAESLDVYKTNSLLTSQTLGDLFVEYGNFFMLLFSHTVSISSTDAYSVENQTGSGS